MKKKNHDQATCLAKIEQKMEDLMKKHDLKITEMVNGIGIQRTGYDRLITRKSCNITTLEKIANYFELPIAYFIDDPRTENSLSYINEPKNEYSPVGNSIELSNCKERVNILDASNKELKEHISFLKERVAEYKYQLEMLKKENKA